MGKNYYVVSDVHGHYEALMEALYSADIFDNHGQKDPKAFVIQIGDLANCVYESREDDLRCLELVGKEIDLMLVGNHEIPYFDPTNRFSGFYAFSEVAEALFDLELQGLLKPSYVVGKTLITHAGVSRAQMPLGCKGPDCVHHVLSQEWELKNYSHRLFRDVGSARSGSAKLGGMLWCDFNKEFVPTNFPQVVGHTPGILRQKGNTICIDTGAKHGGVPTVIKIGA